MEGDASTCTYDELENIIINGSSGPCSLPLEYLRRITNYFSDGRLLGEGGFGKVYKGVLQNEKVVAVKRLDQLLKPGVQERQFENEVYHLMRLKHHNIVRFLGYCYETRNECVEHDGKYIFAEMQQKLICLEYLPNESLDRHLSDEYSGHEWHTRYKIIKGICCGLLYLHEECQCHLSASIIHLDLKPANILLDEHMEPKIADFGLSRLLEQNKTQTCATFLSGSLGYMAPEYLIGQIVTAKADIYNLGVIIIEIITGSKVSIFSFSSPTSCQKFVDGVINNWRNRPGGASSEADCKQIKYCLDIALGCIKFNREERPTAREITERLDRWETTNCNVNSESRPAADQILTHTEEKASVSTTGYESIFCALQPNTTDVRSTAAADDNSNTNTGAGPRPCDDSQNGWRALSLFHRQLWRLLCKDSTEEFTFAQMEAATMGFSLEAKIGEGSFGTVYRGYLPDGREVAIKRGESGPRDDRRFQESEFLSKVAFLSRLRHKHLVDLVGYCTENDERLLVSEYMRNGALYDHLHLKAAHLAFLSCLRHKHLVGYCPENKESLLVCEYMKKGTLCDHLHSKAAPSESSPSLVMSSWKVRIRILLDASQGIESSRTGTVGYMDPDYYGLHHLTVKSDVYGFGVVMLEVLTGKRAILEESEGASPLSVVDYVVPSIISGELSKVLDPRVPEPAAHEAEALGLVAYVALHCVRLQGKDRPGMEGIVANLETAFALCEGNYDGDLVKSPSSDSLPVITPIDQDIC